MMSLFLDEGEEMSFICGQHGWKHGQSACPVCAGLNSFSEKSGLITKERRLEVAQELLALWTTQGNEISMTDRETLKAEILAGFRKAILALTDGYLEAYKNGQQIEIFVERGKENRAVFGIGVRESEAKKAGKK